jgi:hypothetical protein
MIRNSTYIVVIAIILLTGCKQLEPIERPFFLAGWTQFSPLGKADKPTYPVLVFRTPGFGLWAKELTRLEMGEQGSLTLLIGEVEVTEMPAGTHRVAVHPEREGFEYCELDLVVTAGQPPPYIEIFERQNPTGKMLSMVLAEAEAAIKFPVDPGMTCFGHFGVRQGVIPEGVSLEQAKTAITQTD